MGFAGGMTISAIKRDRGVKDYGTLVEGHGGVLGPHRLDLLRRPRLLPLHPLVAGPDARHGAHLTERWDGRGRDSMDGRTNAFFPLQERVEKERLSPTTHRFFLPSHLSLASVKQPVSKSASRRSATTSDSRVLPFIWNRRSMDRPQFTNASRSKVPWESEGDNSLFPERFVPSMLEQPRIHRDPCIVRTRSTDAAIQTTGRHIRWFDYGCTADRSKPRRPILPDPSPFRNPSGKT